MHRCCPPQAMTSTQFLVELVKLRKQIEDFQEVGGIQGLSAYQIAIINGFVGTQPQWLASLKGEQGVPGIQGIQGIPGKQIEVQGNGNILQYRYVGDTDWVDIFDLSSLPQFQTLQDQINALIYNDSTAF